MCGHNFNECETFFQYVEPSPGNLPVLPMVLCPKCYDEKWIPNDSNQKYNIFRKIIKDHPEFF